MASETRHFRPESGNWRLDVTRHVEPEAFDPELKPVLMIPGYAMNAFILGFHPTGRSMIGYLIDQGFEVWTANLRGQGESLCMRGDDEFGFAELTGEDLPAVRSLVGRETESTSDRVDVIGCSLGASYIYGYLTRHLDDHGVGSVVAIGGPLRWETVHPAVRLLFANPAVASALPSKGTRMMARFAIPFVKHLPPIAAIYMNVHQIDLERADELVKTVEDPQPRLNRQISHWIRDRDLIIDGLNVTSAMDKIETPALCVLANRDGIVPPDSALSVLEAVATDDVHELNVGTEHRWFAHADLFISEYAEREVFAPMADWLLSRQSE